MTRQRSLHQRLSDRRALVGLLQTHPSPLLVKMASKCGYDFLFLDAEHGIFAESDYRQIIGALAATDVLAMVRLANQDASALTGYVAAGADAIIVPHVSTADEAKAMVRARDEAVGAARWAHRSNDIAPSTRTDRAAVGLIVIIESALGVANAEEILALDGVDAALVGPSDLSADLGGRGNYSSDAYADALSRVERAAARTGKALGTVPHGEHTLEALLRRGHRIFVMGSDIALISEAMSAQIARAHSSVQSRR